MSDQRLRKGRDPGVDLARGLAVLFMMETHAYDGWTTAQAKATTAYHVSRVFSSIPAPLFLLFAGVGLAFQAHAADRRGMHAPRAVARRGLEIVGYGYLVSLVYALLEGRGALRLDVLLRADILHCIGLSIMLCASLLGEQRRILLRSALLCAAALCGSLLGGWVLRHAGPLPSPLAPFLALLLRVPPYTRFPLLPLCGFTAMGVAAGDLLRRHGARLTPGYGVLASLAFAALAAVFHLLTRRTLIALGGPLTTDHPAVVWNFLDGGCRALAVLALCLELARLRQGVLLRTLLRLGRGSLLAYAFHVPLCYGRPAALLRGHLDMLPATLALIGLIALTFVLVRVRDGLRAVI